MSHRTVYQLDPAGYLVGEERAYESPLEPGVFPLPAGCIETAPPALAEGERARWAAGAWEIVPPEPEPPPEEDLPRTQEELLHALAMMRARQEAGGIEMSGQTFASDLVAAVSVDSAMAFITTAGRPTTRWKAWNGWVELTHLQLTELRVLIGTHRERCFAAEERAAAEVAVGDVTTYAQAAAAYSAHFEEL